MLNYKLYQLEFSNGVRFGNGMLNSTEISFHADTLFAALFQEALKLRIEDIFLDAVKNGKIVLSDAFPYIEKTLYLPKPMYQNKQKIEKRGDSKQKKKIKNMKFIPCDEIENFINGTMPENEINDMQDLGKHSMKVSVGILGNEEPMPYRVSSFHFNDGSGLYIIVGTETVKESEMFYDLLESLSYQGLGGKKSSGLGRFDFLEKELPEALNKRIGNKATHYMLLATALPEDDEFEQSLDGAFYSLVKRSGFVASDTYSVQQMKKRDLYVIASGSVFNKIFKGKVVEERNGGTHPVYRYEKALFMGVNV